MIVPTITKSTTSSFQSTTITKIISEEAKIEKFSPSLAACFVLRGNELLA
jgi:hypothetical protein